MVTTGRTRIHTSDHLSLLAEWSVPANPVAAAVLCHPHPEFGGNMDVTLIDALFRKLPAQSIATLRFNFRGVGVSEGDFDGGQGEQLDVAAAVAEAATLGVGVWAMGWSFGAELALSCVDPAVVGWFAIAPPLRILDSWAAAYDPRPITLAIPEHDQFNPPPRAAIATASWQKAELITVPNTDHFLAGREAFVCDAAITTVGALDGFNH